ncbi:hypothetical protein GGI12_005424 [Dipsacomyces acuminosporus]|nr:hypothetical protein GGI12_005424 [Dipsacomyces acuminosporus]
MAATKPAESVATKKSIFQDVIDSIFEPGVNHGVLVVMNCAFFGLFVILLYLLFATRFNIHVCALTVIATLLFASIQWFIKEVAASKAAGAQASSSELKPKPKPSTTSSKKKKL